MSLAERKAAEINASLDRETLHRQWVIEGKIAARAGSSALWDALVTNVSEQVATFAQAVIAAKTLSIQARSDSFSVQTTVFPIVQLHVNRIALGLNASSTIQRHCLGFAKQQKPKLYRFATDNSLEPCFSDYERELTPSELADILLFPLFDAFTV